MSLPTLKALVAQAAKWNVVRRLDNLRVDQSASVTYWRVRAAHGGVLKVAADSMVEAHLIFERRESVITVGQRSFVGRCQISSAVGVEIGDDVMIAWNAAIFDHGSHALRFDHRKADVQNWRAGKKDWSNVSLGPVHIGNKAWVGYGSIVLPGVQIGEGAVVGAGSVVTKSVAPWTVVAGNPARVVRELGPDER